MNNRSLTAEHFDAIYTSNSDPWDFATSEYERDKYDRTLSALPRSHYASVFEVGCSIGVLTHQLATRCDHLLSVDASEIPLTEARKRCRGYPFVRFDRMTVPQEWPSGQFDLVVLSEVVYYLCADDVARLCRRMEASLAPGGDVLLAHWTGPTNYPLSGDLAAEIFLSGVGGFTEIVRRDRFPKFRLDVVTRRQALS